MNYRKVGKWGLKISEVSLGSWLTFGNQLDIQKAKEIVREAFKNGINFFDTAEAYANGMAESMLGEVLKEFKRSDIVVSTKIFWGGNGPNDRGLSRKHILEGTFASLKRLQLDYVDIVYCHRPDPETPIEETVLAMDYLVRNGYALYWGTSEWSGDQLEKAHIACKELNCIPPIVEQPQYNMLVRDRVEKEYQPIYEKYGMGLTIWSPLASGILTGKYNNGIPEDSRLARFPNLKKHLEENGILTEKTFEKLQKLQKIADELNAKLSQLAIAWCLLNPNVSSVILGVSKIEQLHENLKAIEIKEKITEDIEKEIRKILEE
ncbi:alcohol dehydrogenase [Thermosipho affectus]|uniref:Alcohol dehydrogenase n=1 Tax=Thermosipho affectus TaxID=660294 RepID=A0ABX3IKP2_9BACT|nr:MULTISPECIES: aldo/keto reductase [Thermosipho]ANQ53270.1 NADP-dependent aryl-alcohol dehydrogenase [Thermosipho sp. 1070]APT71720.1 alcohol dehydrogenase [Thermosipho sp. 1063]ONN27744.1 alcohol dehydrogenase [Thermosipho affectus]OOC45235.1 alcohol dehydrogenase [Thermosipho sp. 1074]